MLDKKDAWLKRSLILIITGAILSTAGLSLAGSQFNIFDAAMSHNGPIDENYMLQPNASRWDSYPVWKAEGEFSVSVSSDPKGIPMRLTVYSPDQRELPIVKEAKTDYSDVITVTSTGPYDFEVRNLDDSPHSFRLLVYHTSIVPVVELFVVGALMLVSGLIITPIGVWLRVREGKKKEPAPNNQT